MNEKKAAPQEQDPMVLYGQVVSAMLQSEKQGKRERFARLNRYVKKGQILFAGSSLMEQFPIYEFLMDYDLPYTIYNRGIGGYTTQELLDSMEVCIYDLEPAAILLNIGTNDLNDRACTLDGMLTRYEEIVQGIREHLPQTKLYLLAFYPVNQTVMTAPFVKEAFRARSNERIREANRAIQHLADRYGACYLDLNAGITDSEGNLRTEFTVEGIHMYADGYAAVLHELEPILKELTVLP